MGTDRFIVGLILLAVPAFSIAQSDPVLPAGVRPVWDMDRAWRQKTPTRERVCLNGLWRWQPATDTAGKEPAGQWGYFKVPGQWPGITDYLQKDSQTLYPHPDWKNQNLRETTAAWYQREVVIPPGWSGRGIALSVQYLNSLAEVFVDGEKAGELRFPAGEVDLSAVCRPGRTHVLSLRVSALPLKAVMLSYTDSASARQVKGSVPRRGLCGDVYLVATPKAARLADVKVETSVRRGQLSVGARLEGLTAGDRYTLRARVTEGDKTVHEFAGPAFKGGDAADGRFTFSADWKPPRLWDLHTPANTYGLQVSLLDAGGGVIDEHWAERLGFREFWIDGRDFYLNGTRVFLAAVPIDNALIGAASATYDAARQTLRRLKGIGINCVYTHNYDCTPGSHLSFEEILRAADDEGVLVALSQPHFSQYDWKAPDADEGNGYARHAEFYVRVARNHPSVVFYSMSHNATGYDQDMNPDLIDGTHDARDTWSSNNAKLALRAEAIVRKLDPTRVVYHHAGGNTGAVYTANFYPNFAPAQELSDWFAHWAESGTKPLFLCEYGAPFTWDWTMYRGWYKGKREFGSAAVPWEFCLAEWNGQFLGDRAFAPTDREKANLRWEAEQFRAGKVWHRWDYPTPVGSESFDGRNEVLARYLAENWRSFRALGVSGISPWEYEIYWKLRDGVDKGRRELKVDWDNLQRPGFSPDYIDRPLERMDVAFEPQDWVPTAAGKALLRNNQPVLAYIAGKPDAVTSKDHTFCPGEVIEKQLVVVNNSRKKLAFACEWSFNLSPPVTGRTELAVETGDQARVPLRFELPRTLAPGACELRATIRYDAGQEQADAFTIHTRPAPVAPKLSAKVALFDPRGDTTRCFNELGIAFRPLGASAQPADDEVLVIGKLALTVDGPAPDLSRVPDGLRVVVFEQSAQVLERRLGFRVVEHGLRQVFPRVPDHPALAGVPPEQLRDWRGEATTVPPRLRYELVPQHGPTVQWCGIPVNRVWRCGNRGNVASVLIEKPARGDFLPLLDGGFSLQYGPLMEYRRGKGMILFCQIDVTGRTETEPTAQALLCNLLGYASNWTPAPARRAVYAGETVGKEHLATIGIAETDFPAGGLAPTEHVLVVGPGGGRGLSPHRQAIKSFLEAGGHLLALGLEQQDLDAVLPFKVGVRSAEHVGAVFAAPGLGSPLAGVGPADVFVRAPREIPLVTAGATIVGDGVLATQSRVVLCQIAPWRFDYRQSYNLKRTFRRTSFLVNRILANMGVSGTTPLLDRFQNPPRGSDAEKRWLNGYYLDDPEEWDDPYRFFRW